MDQSSLHTDEDQDSLFGSPPPSPARGRSPSQETFVEREQVGPMIAIPSTGVGRKNVGTIALPGSHMSCAELPADLPAPSLSLSRPTPSHDSRCSIADTPSTTRAPIAASRLPLRSAPHRASSTPSSIPSAPTRKRRTPKAKSLTPAPPAPPITLPGPNEPTPPNFLRSQSSLLGRAGLVGCVRPAQLYAHGSQPILVRQPSPVRGSTPTHPIVLDDDQDASHIGGQRGGQYEIPQRLDQLNPDILRSNIMNSLTKEKNIFPVLESLIKLLGGEPYTSSATPPPQPFARPYGHGIFSTQSPPPLAPHSATGGSTTPTVPPPKRRKLKHVPAGAVDWDVPFPFTAGEGPKGYHENWPRDRAKQLVTQLLELIQNAAKRAAIKTAKSRENASEGRSRAQNRRSSRSTSVETQTNSTRVIASESSLHASSNPEGPEMETSSNMTSVDNLCHFLGLLGSPSRVGSPTPGSKDRTVRGSEGAVAEDGSTAPCDYSAFEEWLSQLQQFIPSEADAPDTCSPLPAGSSNPGLTSDIHASAQCEAASAPHTTQDEAIDPALLAISQLRGSAPPPQSSTSPAPTFAPGNIPQVLDTSTPSMLSYSPCTSLSSLTEPLTPLSEAFVDAPTSMIVHQDADHGMGLHPYVREVTLTDLLVDPSIEQSAEKDRCSQTLLASPIEPPCVTRVQKGKRGANVSGASPTPFTSSRSTPSAVSTSKGALDKQAILERARERRKQLVAEIERAKIEIWETSIENAVLVHFLRDGSLGS